MIGCRDQSSNQIHRHRLTGRLSSSREFPGKIREFVFLYPVHAQYSGEYQSMYHQPENKREWYEAGFSQYPNFLVYFLMIWLEQQLVKNWKFFLIFEVLKHKISIVKGSSERTIECANATIFKVTSND